LTTSPARCWPGTTSRCARAFCASPSSWQIAGQIAGELGLAVSDVQVMTEQLRRGLAARTPAVELTGEVEIDEVYVVAGHKGQPAACQKGRLGRRRRLAGAPGRGTLAKDKPPTLGLI
jgi:hypothetical protein